MNRCARIKTVIVKGAHHKLCSYCEIMGYMEELLIKLWIIPSNSRIKYNFFFSIFRILLECALYPYSIPEKMGRSRNCKNTSRTDTKIYFYIIFEATQQQPNTTSNGNAKLIKVMITFDGSLTLSVYVCVCVRLRIVPIALIASYCSDWSLLCKCLYVNNVIVNAYFKPYFKPIIQHTTHCLKVLRSSIRVEQQQTKFISLSWFYEKFLVNQRKKKEKNSNSPFCTLHLRYGFFGLVTKLCLVRICIQRDNPNFTINILWSNLIHITRAGLGKPQSYFMRNKKKGRIMFFFLC